MFNTYMGMLMWPMIAMGWVVNLMQRGTASLKRINELLTRETEHYRPAGRSPSPSHSAKSSSRRRDGVHDAR